MPRAVHFRRVISARKAGSLSLVCNSPPIKSRHSRNCGSFQVCRTASSALRVFWCRRWRSWIRPAIAVAIMTSSVMALRSSDHLSIDIASKHNRESSGLKSLHVCGWCGNEVFGFEVAVRLRTEVAALAPQFSRRACGTHAGRSPSPNSKPWDNHGSDVIGGILNRIQRRVYLRRVKINKAQRVSKR